MDKYNPAEIEPKWQKVWEEKGINGVDIKGAKRPFYNLMMFPYPSAEGLHVGNMYAFTAADIYGRFQRMQGYAVFEPIGLDGFGIHSENYALKVGRHPKDHAAMTEKNFYAQLHKIGAMYDWTRTVETYHPDYYRWTQWLFVQMFKAGLAYRAKASVNFCPQCKTVLSDEQVIAGKCERCSTPVVKKELEQWFFKITAYAEKLLSNLDTLDWSEKIKIAQRNWIGKKEGINIRYEVQDTNSEVEIFTTRPDTNFGATFIVLAPEHELCLKIVTDENKREIEGYIAAARAKSEQERIAEGRKKTGVFTGRYAVNQLTGRKMPIWVADFVLASVGTGAVVGVPGHDKRDFEFAKEFGLEIVRVVVGRDHDTSPITKIEQVQEEEGKMINSGFLDGLGIHEATERIIDYIEEKGWGKRVTIYHLRDWLISRQRYWGAPIPMIDCQACGWQPVPESQLPVLLPDIKDYQPEGTGKGPLANHTEFYKTTCPRCGADSIRETDVCDTFLDSSWYFLRYPSTRSARSGQVPFDKEITRKWLPVDMYTGGAEHAVLHLMYSRFVTMVLHDLGYLSFEEPFTRFFAHGLLIKDGAKMSKSRGNVVSPDEYIAKYGADALRLYLMFMGPVENGGDFRDSGMEGMKRWVDRVWAILLARIEAKTAKENPAVERELSKLIIKAEEGVEARHYNIVIAKMMEFLNFVTEKEESLTKDQIQKFLLVLAPFAPHLAEELWQELVAGPAGLHPTPTSSPAKGETAGARVGTPSPSPAFVSVHQQLWPKASPPTGGEGAVVIAVAVNGKTRSVLEFSAAEAKVLDQKRVEAAAKDDSRVAKYLEGKKVKRVVYVPGKIINFVVE